MGGRLPGPPVPSGGTLSRGRPLKWEALEVGGPRSGRGPFTGRRPLGEGPG